MTGPRSESIYSHSLEGRIRARVQLEQDAKSWRGSVHKLKELGAVNITTMGSVYENMRRINHDARGRQAQLSILRPNENFPMLSNSSSSGKVQELLDADSWPHSNEVGVGPDHEQSMVVEAHTEAYTYSSYSSGSSPGRAHADSGSQQSISSVVSDIPYASISESISGSNLPSTRSISGSNLTSTRSISGSNLPSTRSISGSNVPSTLNYAYLSSSSVAQIVEPGSTVENYYSPPGVIDDATRVHARFMTLISGAKVVSSALIGGSTESLPISKEDSNASLPASELSSRFSDALSSNGPSSEPSYSYVTDSESHPLVDTESHPLVHSHQQLTRTPVTSATQNSQPPRCVEVPLLNPRSSSHDTTSFEPAVSHSVIEATAEVGRRTVTNVDVQTFEVLSPPKENIPKDLGAQLICLLSKQLDDSKDMRESLYKANDDKLRLVAELLYKSATGTKTIQYETPASDEMHHLCQVLSPAPTPVEMKPRPHSMEHSVQTAATLTADFAVQVSDPRIEEQAALARQLHEFRDTTRELTIRTETLSALLQRCFSLLRPCAQVVEGSNKRGNFAQLENQISILRRDIRNRLDVVDDPQVTHTMSSLPPDAMAEPPRVVVERSPSASAAFQMRSNTEPQRYSPPPQTESRFSDHNEAIISRIRNKISSLGIQL